MQAIQCILVPVDFSSHSAQALDYAIGLAKVLGAKLELLHCYQIQAGSISPYGLVLPENFDRQVREAAAAKLDEWTEKASAEGVPVAARLSSMFPSLAIQDAAQEVGADLIVMGTRGLSGIKHVLLGSVAERTVRSAPCPVLTVRSEETD